MHPPDIYIFHPFQSCKKFWYKVNYIFCRMYLKPIPCQTLYCNTKGCSSGLFAIQENIIYIYNEPGQSGVLEVHCSTYVIHRPLSPFLPPSPSTYRNMSNLKARHYYFNVSLYVDKLIVS